MADAEQRDDKAWRRVWLQHALRASTRTTARSAVEAPVAMLRVYCSWPGVSATMNLRLAVGEEAIGDVDGDALLALGLQPVDQQREVDVVAGRAVLAANRAASVASWSSKISLRVVEQPADQRRLAVVDGAAGQEAQQRLAVLLGELGVQAGRRRRLRYCVQCASSEISLALLLLHRAGLVVVDQPALPLGGARRSASRRRCLRALSASDSIAPVSG